ncbi:amidohydrolase [Williamsia sterculiae]|uniref:Amidohydrolase 3 domain-containing protein n=1 Tax=Williamsia sterculiae TaxID=1344003 RepID=A0A1N7EQG0_9NOCA|nr:amidohydrolase family protein [Williamsia sterculiae]SIR90338.1 hypothetical protein SAMN05445060_1573 [Williamsia sterculiae]
MSRSADAVITAATIHTLTNSDPVTAVAVTNGIITGVGDRASLIDQIGRTTQVLDLGVGTLTPGLIDGHIHPVIGLHLTVGVDLSTVVSYDDLVVALQSATLHDGWLRGWGLDPNVFGDRPVTYAPIVEAVGDEVPVFINLFDAHAALVSPAGLRLAGISGPRDFASSADIVCRDGVPTGHLLELEAIGLVTAVLPAEATADRRIRFRELLTAMAHSGITSGNAMDFEGDSAELVVALEDEGDLPIRLRFAPFCMPGFGSDALDHIVDLQRRRGRRWRVDGVKFLIDGTIDAGTAWLDHADTYGESTAPFWPEPDRYRSAVRHLARRGVPTVTHAIGDAGIRYALDSLVDIAPATSGARHRIEHIETMPDDLVPRFAQQGVVASMQPTHCTHYTRADHTDNWSQRLGVERAQRAFRTRDLRDAGATLALGSDWPVAPFNPRSIMADARLRRRSGHVDEEPIVADQALTAAMALEGYTLHAARAEGARRAGQIKVGNRADFTGFAVDPLAAPPDEVADAPVVLTVVDGQVVYHR